ncbi:hypothetical protein ACFQJC_00490 [Haloferax namakaokahaiae]|uniref:CbaC protein n=1 Tax=Haloferax namakaokahaiae TaxID=1748331 RepID=A0ABD5Z9V1_9EURY
MVNLHIGKHGALLVVFLFFLLEFEDILIWVNTGSTPAIEFFVASLVVLGVVVFAVREAVAHPPPRH